MGAPGAALLSDAPPPPVPKVGLTSASTWCGEESSPDLNQSLSSAADGGYRLDFSPAAFDFQALLGKGSFGAVYKAEHRPTRRTFAVKVLSKSKYQGNRMLNYALSEKDILSTLRHPFLLTLNFAFQTQEHLVLLLPYHPGGSVSELLRKNGPLPLNLAQLYCAEVFLALEHLHERGIVHRDMKAANVVLDEESHAVLTDFGLAVSDAHGPTACRDCAGTAAYLAPEVVKKERHGSPVDIYGLGVFLFEMLTGHIPFFSLDRQKLRENIVNKELHIPKQVPEAASLFIRQTMDRNPMQRYGAENTSLLRRHSFFTGLSWEDVFLRQVAVPKHGRQLFSFGGSFTARKHGADVQNPLKKESRQEFPHLDCWDFHEPVSPPEEKPARKVSAVFKKSVPKAPQLGRRFRGECLICFWKPDSFVRDF